MRLILPLIVFLLAGLALVGCGVPRQDVSTARDRKPRDAPVEVFITKTPSRPYDEIGLIHVQSPQGSLRTIDKLKSETRRMGGDAVIVQQGAGVTDVITVSKVVTSGVVIVWTDKPSP